MGINIEIKVLSKSKMPGWPDIYELQVFCSNAKYEWIGQCHGRDLQKCMEHGLGLLGLIV